MFVDFQLFFWFLENQVIQERFEKIKQVRESASHPSCCRFSCSMVLTFKSVRLLCFLCFFLFLVFFLCFSVSLLFVYRLSILCSDCFFFPLAICFFPFLFVSCLPFFLQSACLCSLYILMFFFLSSLSLVFAFFVLAFSLCLFCLLILSGSAICIFIALLLIVSPLCRFRSFINFSISRWAAMNFYRHVR